MVFEAQGLEIDGWGNRNSMFNLGMRQSMGDEGGAYSCHLPPTVQKV